ncbi:MAG: sigma-70 family RNA polymerase sigma factor [Deltaproteobacteria bacterium]|nr:sigma-70 family RNA polymerase sigma factor [Deltaproteobacteria bacterium]
MTASAIRSTPSASRETASFGASDRGFVYAVARRIVGNGEDADDVTQEALLLAYRHRDSFRGDARYRTWLYRIASTTALGHLRRRRRSREYLAANDEALGVQVADPARSPEDCLAKAEEAAIVQGAVARLDPKFRDVVVARAESTESETAAQLGISVANVKIRGHRGRKQLRESLSAIR